MLSTHKVEIVPVSLERHENADTLSVVRLFGGGYSCVVRTADWLGRETGAWIPPDSVVDVSRPEFAFLAKGTKTLHRVRAVKLRGAQSYGLLMPAPAGSRVGDDVAEYYGVTHYEPEIRGACTGGEAESAPTYLAQVAKYDIDALLRYVGIFEEGEPVYVTEKIHGANSRYVYYDGRMWCGSRSEWKRDEERNLWWRALRETPSIAEFCKSFPGCVLYGEVYGDVQSLQYGTRKGEVRFAAFDILRSDGRFMDSPDFAHECGQFNIPRVPVLRHMMSYNLETIRGMADGPSLVPGADHFREGCVVKPVRERWHQAIGRVCLKIVGTEYLEKG